MTEAGYCRVLLDIKDTRLMELESEITKLRIEYEKQIVKLQEENAELNEKLSEQKLYTEFKCNEAVNEKEVYEKEHFLLTKAKELIKKLKALYLYPVVTKDDVKRQDEILNETEQFLKDSEVEK